MIAKRPSEDDIIQDLKYKSELNQKKISKGKYKMFWRGQMIEVMPRLPGDSDKPENNKTWRCNE